MRKFIILSMLSLGACTTPQPVIKYVDQPVMVYPNLPPVPAIPKPRFYPVNFILPKDSTGNIETIATCVEKSTTPETANKNCTAGTTNIFIGLDQTDYVHLLINLQAMRGFATEAQDRINQENVERSYWATQNKKPASVSLKSKK